MKLDPNTYYMIKELVRAFKESGMPVSAAWIRRQENKGNLKVPRSTTNFKKSQGIRTIAPVRKMTGRQIQEIVKAFLPGGEGCYDFRLKDQSSEKFTIMSYLQSNGKEESLKEVAEKTKVDKKDRGTLDNDDTIPEKGSANNTRNSLPELLTYEQISIHLGVSKTTVNRYSKRKKNPLPVIYLNPKVKKAPRIKKADYLNWIENFKY